jgi:exonuclease III
MRVIVWNMKAAFGITEESHRRTWDYLGDQSFDVALLQETRNPADFADWCSFVWRPKYARPDNRHPLWGTAVISRSVELQEPELDETFPWLRGREGSTAIARTDGSPTWLVSVHAHSSAIPKHTLDTVGDTGVPRSTPNGSVWETDVIPHELHRLFGEESFIWGGDLNSAATMDDVSGFAGGNRRLREIWSEAGFYDLRLGIYHQEQQTFFAPRRRAYQLDHVFADEETSRRVKDWRVDRTPVELDPPLSDHAPIVVDLDSP